MSAALWQALRASHSHTYPLACRFVAGRRLRSLRPCLHTSSRQLAENEPKGSPQGSWRNLFIPSAIINETAPDQRGPDGSPEEGPEKPSKPPDLSHYGSALRRAGRNVKKVKELPQVHIPQWLLDRNVAIVEEARKNADRAKERQAPSNETLKGSDDQFGKLLQPTTISLEETADKQKWAEDIQTECKKLQAQLDETRAKISPDRTGEAHARLEEAQKEIDGNRPSLDAARATFSRLAMSIGFQQRMIEITKRLARGFSGRDLSGTTTSEKDACAAELQRQVTTFLDIMRKLPRSQNLGKAALSGDGVGTPGRSVVSREQSFSESDGNGTMKHGPSERDPIQPSDLAECIGAIEGILNAAEKEMATMTGAGRDDPTHSEQVFITEDIHEESPDAYLQRQLKVHTSTVDEITSLVQAGLNIPLGENAQDTTSIRPHITLSCPRKGGSAYLASFVRGVAQQHKADLFRLSAQDIAEIGGAYLEDASDFHMDSLSSLGYDIAQISISQNQSSYDDFSERDEWEAAEEDENQEGSRQSPKSFSKVISLGVIPGLKLEELFKQTKKPDWTNDSGQSSKTSTEGQSIFRMKDDTEDMKLTLLIETLLNAPELKRRKSTPESVLEANGNLAGKGNADNLEEQRGSHSLVVLIEDYPLINMTPYGNKVLDKLHQVVEARRKEGQPVLIVGTTSSDTFLPSRDAKTSVDRAQSQHWDRRTRNVVVPIQSKSDDGLLWLEHKRKVREINLRHLRDMLRRIAPNREQVKSIVDDWDMTLESKYAYIAALDRGVWPLDKVNRIATVSLGLLKQSESMTTRTIGQALAVIDASDTSKYKWHKKDVDKSRNKDESRTASTTPQEESEDKVRKLRKKCNSHEKKLLNGVIDAKSIRTTFADVQAPAETIDALKTLTSLSLVRPDAFTYGVLATDRIPGILLYGPPGTGKTLLAKAVAKESGATVLEVSGSDVYDMYVGEGEKNVRAIFSLAKKLSPCVVFIDEADAILGSRSGGHSRTSHRELINQFLREWDGMTDTSAFIMVATNRPYDLDEASLRRVPRRLLIDLPVEKDREAILRIHLKGESLSSDVSIPDLASRTPFYSGSDLKNLCVAAALACVREEYEAATVHNKSKADSDSDYQYAEKRTLTERHFEKAMEEISASISEDMGSLSAIRKFDEKYGDRRGRKKKLGGYGFKTVEETEKMGSDAARVRNQS